MKGARAILIAVSLPMLTACAEPHAPFPASFEMTAVDEFEFVATGTTHYPVNTKEGEEGRMTWLTGYLARNHFCPDGFKIERRVPAQLLGGDKPGVDQHRYRSITYLGRCQSPDHG
jgi:hypothetical protein